MTDYTVEQARRIALISGTYEQLVGERDWKSLNVGRAHLFGYSSSQRDAAVRCQQGLLEFPDVFMAPAYDLGAVAAAVDFMGASVEAGGVELCVA